MTLHGSFIAACAVTLLYPRAVTQSSFIHILGVADKSLLEFLNVKMVE